jgi:hypothetical protein
LHAHAFIIAAIFIPYLLLMSALFAYMAHQVQHRDGEHEDDVRQDEDPGGRDRAEIRLAA